MAHHNATKLAELGTEVVDYPTTTYKKDGREKRSSNKLAVGCKAIVTKNMTVSEKPVYNGMRVTVTETREESVTVVDENGKLYDLGYVEDKEDDKVTERYVPVEACYALTIHKSQGQTVDSAVVHVDGLFEEGMAYVALSRVRDLNKLQIASKINREDRGWYPNSFALEFYRSGKTISADQMLFIPDSKKQLKGVRRLTWKAPVWNHIYIDFETFVDGFVQRPYYNHLLHVHGDQEVAKQSFFD